MGEGHELKRVQLKGHKFFMSLISKGGTFQDYKPEHSIGVIAVEGRYNDWTAYFETPQTPGKNVLEYGNKLPEDVAKDLFPEWAKKKLKWRD